MMEAFGEGRRNLILGAAQDYEWDVLRPFVESLRATGYDGEIRFFVSGLSRETVGQLAARGVDVMRPSRARRRMAGHVFSPYNPRTTRLRWHAQPYLSRLVRLLVSVAPNRRDAAGWLVGFLGNIEVARYAWYYRYLKEHRDRYHSVMLSDVRDVVFLADPFSFDVGDAAWFFLENESLRLRDQTNNRGWLIGAYGEAAFEAIGDCPISCSGLTIGSADAMLGYLELMVDELAGLSRQFKGMDQGVHNHLLHNGLVPRAHVAPNAEGPVLTVGIMDGDEASKLLHDRRAVVKVVHQYDRHEAVATELASLLGTTL